MPAKKLSKAAKEALPPASSLADGVCTYYVGGWSHCAALSDVTHIAHARIAAHTAPDRTQTPLPRTSVLVLPGVQTRALHADNENDDKTEAAADDDEHVAVVQVADQMHIEGVTHVAVRAAARRVKSWGNDTAAAGTQEAAHADDKDTVNMQQQHNNGNHDGRAAAAVALDDANDDDNDAAAAQSSAAAAATAQTFGATRAADDVCVTATPATRAMLLVGVLPQIVVTPELPAGATTAAAGDAAAAAAAAVGANTSTSGRGKGAAKTTATGSASRRKSKVKQTPEEAAEEARQLAERAALLQQQTAAAIARAQQHEAFLMTFAHPQRWVNVTVSSMTFALPVTVRSAHVTFRNCCFVDATAMMTTTRMQQAGGAAAETQGSDEDDEKATQLTVSQYCRVTCVYCTFAVSSTRRGAAVRAQPTSQVTLDACLFTGASPHSLAALPPLDTLSSSTTTAAAVATTTTAMMTGTSDAAAAAAATAKAVATAADAASTVVGVSADDAYVTIKRCRFCYLATGVLLRGAPPVAAAASSSSDDVAGYGSGNEHERSAGAGATSHKTRSNAATTATTAAATAAGMRVLQSYVHDMYNSGVVVCEGACGVAVQGCYFAHCAHYAIDCRPRARRVVLSGNVFVDKATPRIRARAHAVLQRNELHSNLLIDDNDYSNTYMQPTY